MIRQNNGCIMNISSIAGRRASPGMGVYGIAKSAVEMLTCVLASELAPFNIRVNAVAPAMVRTAFSEPFWANEDILREIVKSIPLGKIAEPMDVVHPVLFSSLPMRHVTLPGRLSWWMAELRLYRRVPKTN